MRRSGPAAGNRWRGPGDRSQGGARGGWPARVDRGEEGRPCARGRCAGEALRGGVDGTGGAGACRPRIGNRVPQQRLCRRPARTDRLAESAIAKANARLEYVQLQLTRTSTLARQNSESQQALDQAENDAAGARADVAEAQANYDAAVAGPTREERAIADAQVQAAAAAVAVLERRLEKMILRAPADGVVSVIAAEVGENVRAGQPILMVEAAGEQWLSFNVREDHPTVLRSEKRLSVMRIGAAGAIKGVITELQPLGAFATWQAERVIGDHDRNTLRLRLDPEGEPAGLEPGMTVWINN